MPRHPDPDSLALHALGEPALTSVDLTHIEGCPECAESLAALRDTVDVVRGGAQEPLSPVPVPDRVWAGVSSTLGLPADLRPRPLDAPATAGGRTSLAAGTGGPHDGSGHDDPRYDASTHDAPAATELAARRDRRRWAGVLAVAASAVLVAAVGTVAVQRAGEEPPVVLATSQLLEFGAGEGTGAGGSARLLASEGTARDLELRLTGLETPDDGYLEAWLIDPEQGAVVSLGTVDLQAEDIRFTVPEGLDPVAYSVVDVSVEPYDGDPTHSGASLVRGTFDA